MAVSLAHSLADRMAVSKVESKVDYSVHLLVEPLEFLLAAMMADL